MMEGIKMGVAKGTVKEKKELEEAVNEGFPHDVIVGHPSNMSLKFLILGFRTRHIASLLVVLPFRDVALLGGEGNACQD